MGANTRLRDGRGEPIPTIGEKAWYSVYSVGCTESRARICKRLWSPEIYSEESIPPAYVAWPARTTNRVVVPARQDGNRFMGSFKDLQIRALYAKRIEKE
jgi:hypothetical protein